MPLNKDAVLAALQTVKDPELFKDLITLNMVKEIRVDGSAVYVQIELTTPTSSARQSIERDVKAAVAQVGAASITVDFVGKQAGTPHGVAAPAQSALPQVKHVIAVGAGKGGVGKSTIALNLAIALQRAGHAVGLMDGDIYGPSMPTLLGIKGLTPRVVNTEKGQKIVPFHVHGIHAITIGSLVEQEKPLIWRGPMAHGAFKQLLLDNTEWPRLDYLIVDLPPGTGDVPLTLCQLLPLTGAVVVATPQQVALDDAVRAVRMFQQLGAPVLGIVENMSCFVSPDGSRHDIFGHGGAKSTAERLDLPFLGEIPMFPELRINSDAGTPHANFEKNADLRDALQSVATALTEEVKKRDLQPAAVLEIS